MANMILGSYSFEWNPKSTFQIIKPKKHVSVVQTYSSVAVFSWGATLLGEEIKLTWTDMLSEQFDAINTMYQTESEYTLDLRGDSVEIYTVYIINLEGTYFVNYETTSAYRKNVELTLLITTVT